MAKCDICGGHPSLSDYRRRDGDVVCKTCLEEYGCRYGVHRGDSHVTVNEDGPSHPKKSDGWDGGKDD